MSEIPKTLLVIGGSLDGRRIYVGEARRVSIPTISSVSSSCVTFTDVTANWSAAEYRRFRHSIGARIFHVLVPDDWSDEKSGEAVFAEIADQWAKHLDGRE